MSNNRNRNSCAARTARKETVNALELCQVENERQLNRRIFNEMLAAKHSSRSVSAVEVKWLYCSPHLDRFDQDQKMRAIEPRVEYKGYKVY